MTDRAAIVDEARSWIGTPFQHQQSLRGVGCDCIGFVRGVARGVGMNDPFASGEAMKYFGYGRTPEPKAFRAACAAFLLPIGRGDVLPGDILTFRFGPDPMHFAIMADRELPYIVHAYAQAKKVVENRLDHAYWEPKFVSAHRFPELA